MNDPEGGDNFARSKVADGVVDWPGEAKDAVQSAGQQAEDSSAIGYMSTQPRPAVIKGWVWISVHNACARAWINLKRLQIDDGEADG
jgi:hypothetical protein